MKLNRTTTTIATLFLWTTVHAATITVSSTADNGAGTLRNALASVANGDTINFTVTGNILLTTGELLISNSVTIAGPGSAVWRWKETFPIPPTACFISPMPSPPSSPA